MVQLLECNYDPSSQHYVRIYEMQQIMKESELIE